MSVMCRVPCKIKDQNIKSLTDKWANTQKTIHEKKHIHGLEPHEKMLNFVYNKSTPRGWVQWLTHIIPARWEAETGRFLEVRSLRPA